MRDIQPIREISFDDPIAHAGAAEFRHYRDHVGSMSDEDRERYRGTVLAVLSETGEIIASAENVAALRATVAASVFAGRHWRLVDGPVKSDPS